MFPSVQMNFSHWFSDLLHLPLSAFFPHNEVWVALVSHCQLLPSPQVWPPHSHSCSQALCWESPSPIIWLLSHPEWCNPSQLTWRPCNSASKTHVIFLQHIWKEGKFYFVRTITYFELEENNLFGPKSSCFSIKATYFPFVIGNEAFWIST
jgi:hypothetical protein